MNRYQENAINYLRAEIKTARKARGENNVSRFRTICNMIHYEIDYCSIVGIFSIEKKNLLLKITDRMIYDNEKPLE